MIPFQTPSTMFLPMSSIMPGTSAKPPTMAATICGNCATREGIAWISPTPSWTTRFTPVSIISGRFSVKNPTMPVMMAGSCASSEGSESRMPVPNVRII